MVGWNVGHPYLPTGVNDFFQGQDGVSGNKKLRGIFLQSVLGSTIAKREKRRYMRIRLLRRHAWSVELFKKPGMWYGRLVEKREKIFTLKYVVSVWLTLSHPSHSIKCHGRITRVHKSVRGRPRGNSRCCSGRRISEIYGGLLVTDNSAPLLEFLGLLFDLSLTVLVSSLFNQNKDEGG